MGARALDHLRVVLEEAVQFVGQGLHLGGKDAREPLGTPGADVGEGRAHAPERDQAETHLEEHGGDETQAEGGERPDEDSVEVPNLAADLGVLGGDTAGFPNGRRPIDDVVDIELRVAMGVLLTPYDGSSKDPDPASDTSRQLEYTDGAEPNPANYLTVFPYLDTPYAGSPTSAND